MPLNPPEQIQQPLLARFLNFLGLRQSIAFQIGQTVVPVYRVGEDQLPLNLDATVQTVQEITNIGDGANLCSLSGLNRGLYRVLFFGSVDNSANIADVRNNFRLNVTNASAVVTVGIPFSIAQEGGAKMDVTVWVEQGGSIAITKRFANGSSSSTWSGLLIAKQLTLA